MRGWWWSNLWHVVNVFVGAVVALLIAGGLRGYALDALWLVTFLALALFFAFVWPPVPMIELAIRSLLGRRREARHSDGFETVEPGRVSLRSDDPRKLGLHVPQRDIADRRSGKE